MFVGGSTGSTAGGVKTSTIAVSFIFLFAGLRSQSRPILFGRSLSVDDIKKASGVICFNASLISAGVLIISAVQQLSLPDVLFEVFSAMGTVGMTAGITRALAPVSKFVIIALMFLGRVGSVTLASAFLEKRAAPRIMYPVEKISLG